MLWFLLFIVPITAVWVLGSEYLVSRQIPERIPEVITSEATVLEVVVPKVVVPKVVAVPQGEIRLVLVPRNISLNPGITRAIFDGAEVPIFDYSGYVYVLLPVSAQKPVGAYDLEVLEGERVVNSLLVNVVHKEFPKDVLNVSYEFVEFPQEVKDSIREVKQPFLEALQRTVAIRRWSTGFSHPLEVIDITDFFGQQRVYTNYTTPFHSGVDLRAAPGTSVRAISEGRVLWGGDSKLYFEGNAVVIDHGQKIISMYLHLDSVEVEVGDIVRRGQVVGRSGASGFGTGPHLHFAVKVGGKYVGPLQFIGAFQDIR